MPEALIIADDLTGAADTGAQFLGSGPIAIAGLAEAEESPPSSWGLALDTESRDGTEREAPAAMKRTAALIGKLAPGLIYKKIDSCLRGHIGLELAALAGELGLRGVLAAPAYPAFGRVTRAGLHYVAGLPVSESESGRDPRRPVRDSRLAIVLGQGHSLPVKPLGLSVVRSGAPAVARAVREALRGGPAIVAADAETDGDLAVLAESGLALNLVLAGSAGLGRALARRLNGGSRSVAWPAGAERPAVFFCGSASATLSGQIERLVERDGAELFTWRPGLAARPVLPPGRPLVVNLPRPERPPLYSSRELVAGLGALAASLADEWRLKSLFLSGGDTAKAALKALRTTGLRLRAEVEPGVVFMETGHISFFCKSGGFGDRELLSRLYRSPPEPAPGGILAGKVRP